jgi:hydroxymethylglutaryl-CoA lyase
VRFPHRIELRDVTLRDGLQNEGVFVDTAVKLTWLEHLLDAGFTTLEVTSFVRADRVPALRDAEDVAARLPKRYGVEYRALIPNQKGLDRLLETDIDTAVVFLSASTAHNEANVQRTTQQSLTMANEVVQRAVENGRSAIGAIATAFVCPFTGVVPLDDVLAIADTLVRNGVREVSVADTIGQATPRMIYERCQALKDYFPGIPISLHLHNAHGYGLSNVLAGIQAGVQRFDVTQAGLGGCPYAPGAPGNLRASQVARFLEEQGMSTGLDLQRLAEFDTSFRSVIQVSPLIADDPVKSSKQRGHEEECLHE